MTAGASNQPAFPSSSDRIAFLGGGNMARAMIAGLLRQGRPAQCISVGEPREGVRAELARQFSIAVYAENGRAVLEAALIVLAVKPQDAVEALKSLRTLWQENPPAMLSIAAGLRIEGLARLCPPGMTIMRAMPNRPALLAAGVTGLYASASTATGARVLAEQVAAAIGRVVWLGAEAELDVVTAVSGSGPAYFLLLAEQLALAGQSCGWTPGDRAPRCYFATETLLARDCSPTGPWSRHWRRGPAQERTAVIRREARPKLRCVCCSPGNSSN